MSRPRPASVLLAGLALMLASCARTAYRSIDDHGQAAALVERRVTYHLSRSFYRAPPRCATIAEAAPGDAAIVRAVGGAVERHLAIRLPRVIGSRQAARKARRLGVDLADGRDRRVFARQTACDALVTVRLHGVADDYALVWSRRAIGITLEMTRVADGRRLWIARHRAERSDGGVPLSLLSLPFTAYRASRLKGDDEAFQSIADDAVRRMMATLPDVRGRLSRP